MLKQLPKNQILSIELGKKLINNVPGMKIEGSIVPVPDKKVLSKLRRYRQKSFQRSNSKHRPKHSDMVQTEYRSK
jgi:hypothetical protein